MKTCKDCLYEPVCSDFCYNICETDKKRFEEYRLNSDGLCDHFKDKSLVLDLPCKVGDTVYVLTSDSITGFEKSRVKRMLLKNMQDGMTIKIIIPCVCDDWGGAEREFYPEDFGKTVFLTKEAAEQALKEREQG